MRKLIALLGLFLVTLPAFCQSTSKFQIATIVDVKLHNAPGTRDSDPAVYDVSVKVGNTVYVALYTPRLGENEGMYSTGRDLLVQVGNSTITYNDIMGRSYEVPIVSQKSATPQKPKSR
jgi:hypothetical protein